jgi:hypothetical protein
MRGPRGFLSRCFGIAKDLFGAKQVPRPPPIAEKPVFKATGGKLPARHRSPRIITVVRSQSASADAPFITLFRTVGNPDAPTFPLRLSAKKGAEFTEQARNNVVTEMERANGGNRNGNAELKRRILQHYGMNDRTYRKIFRKWLQTNSLRTAPRPGRKSIISPEKQAQLRAANRNARRSSAKVLSKQVKGTTGGGMYRGKRKDHVSKNTLLKMKRQDKYVGVSVQPRPAITEKNIQPRVDCANHLIANAANDSNRTKLDEKIFVVPGLSGQVDIHPDSDPEDESNESLHHQAYKYVMSKRHVPQIMVLAVVTKPELRPGWKKGDGQSKWLHTGKIGLFRVVRYLPAKKGKKMRDWNGQVVFGPPGRRGGVGKPIYIHKKGDIVPVDVFAQGSKGLDGTLYADMWLKEGDFSRAPQGILEAIRAYYAALGRPDPDEEQQDGAPGHGYNNRLPGRPETIAAQRISQKLAQYGIVVYRQSAQSPELNECDLGLWWALQSRVDERAAEFKIGWSNKQLKDHLWKVIQEEWEKLSPRLLYTLAEHKVDVAKAVLAEGGQAIKKEPHDGARARTKAAIAAAMGQ